jgi:glycosyltransferase involved in cell wall biosynthesis
MALMSIALCTLIMIIIALGAHLLSSPSFYEGHQTPSIDKQQPQPRILLICISGRCFGGQEMHTLTFYKMLLKHGYHAALITSNNTSLYHRLKAEDLPFYTTYAGLFRKQLRPFFHIILRRCLRIISKQEHITLIHCNSREEVVDAVAVLEKSHGTTFFTRHDPNVFPLHKVRGVGALIGVSEKIVAELTHENHKQKMAIPTITFIPPFFDAEKFINFVPTHTTREEFFQSHYGITLKPLPLIATIGNMIWDLKHKNYPLLLQALEHLIYHENIPVQAVIAGDGPARSIIEEMAKKLALTDYVYFLGSTNHTPGILYHSDIFVLPSSREAFGIVFLEAGLMKKPAIGAYNTGAQTIIIPEKTGLLFNNDDRDDLVRQIKRLIVNPMFAQELGRNAYDHVNRVFSPEITFAQHEAMYATHALRHQR